MRNLQAVVFDMDGVLFDSESKVIECWKEIACKYGVENVESVCRQCLGLNKKASKEKFLSVYGADFPYDDYKAEMSALFHERYDDGRLPLKPGVRELLDYLKKEEIRIALATSSGKAYAISELTDAGIIDYFDEIVCGDMVERSKPDPDIYVKACEKLSVLPEKAYAIEDSFNGIRSAYRAGLHPIMVPDLVAPVEEIEKQAEVVLASLMDVMHYLEADA